MIVKKEEILGKLSYERHFNNEQERRSQVMFKLIKKYGKPTDSILEIGASFGRNLEVLFDNGFKDVTALEPDENAFNGIRYPEIKRVLGTMQDKLKEMPKYDIIFTKSVLYLTPDPNYEEIANKVKKYLITCEGEERQHIANNELFDRNYKDIFEQYDLKQVENIDSQIFRIKFTPENINDFYIKDKRVGTPRFKEELQGVKGAMLEMKTSPKTKWYSERYDLTVFTYDQNTDKPHLIIDGSHRLEALKEIFKEGTSNFFEAILIPSNILYFNITPTEILEENRKLDKELEKEGIPTWVKKYDYDEEALESVDGRIIVYGKRNIWVNKNLIDSGGKNKKRLTIEEYEATRQKQKETS